MIKPCPIVCQRFSFILFRFFSRIQNKQKRRLRKTFVFAVFCGCRTRIRTQTDGARNRSATFTQFGNVVNQRLKVYQKYPASAILFFDFAQQKSQTNLSLRRGLIFPRDERSASQVSPEADPSVPALLLSFLPGRYRSTA